MPQDSTITYELKVSVPYHDKGEVVEGQFITLSAPSSRNLSECADLKQAFFRAMPKDEAGREGSPLSEADKNNDITGDAIMMLISMSPEVELKKVLLTARELFSSGVAKIDGETKVTKPILDSFSQDDLEDMTGMYLANFILASVLKKMKKL